MDHSSASLLIYLCVAFIAVLAARWIRAQRGTSVDPESAEWRAAVLKAQSSVGSLSQLLAERQAPLIKFALRDKRGEAEHVWGDLKALTTTHFTALLATPLLDGSALAGSTHCLPVEQLEDWQVELPDGRIRGGFTTQLEISAARRARRPIPRHIAAMEGRFVDA
jgi:uncharacterized protein YegJ (DUF2314 family)